MARRYETNSLWEAFDLLVQSIVGTTAASNPYQMQLGWTAESIWQSSITRILLADQMELQGDQKGADELRRAAHERQVVASELLEELKRMRTP